MSTNTNTRSWPLRAAVAIWHGLDRLRRVLHLLLLLAILLLVVVSLVVSLFGERVSVPSKAALVIAPAGALVDQLSGDPLQRALARARGNRIQETALRDVLDALRAARTDDRIKGVVLDLDGLSGAGLSKLQDVAKELEAFKQSGKPVTAVGDGFTRDQYYLAAQADKIYMHPMGQVLIDGYSRFLPYYKSALEKLYIDYNVWTVGEYKSFVEPITRDDMSAQDREASSVFLKALWGAYQNDVTAARKLPADALQRYADNAVSLLAQADGDTAKLAVDYGLVDELLTRDAMRKRIRDSIGASGRGKPHADDFAKIGFEDYVRAVRRSEKTEKASNVAVIVAAGTILDGTQPPGSIGGDSLAELIRQASDDESVKALVLRVDSGGGSAFASDVILRELQAFQDSKRPLVVSMGSVAASGGYWISMGANEIWASPTTLTGSIGVGATIPTFQRLLDKLGVHVDGIGTTELAGALDPTLRGIRDNVKQLIGESVRFTYREFVGKVAEHRKKSYDEIDASARGRVWVGTDALSRGLVDKLGNLEDAIESAAELAGLEKGAYGIDYIEPQLGFSEQLALELTTVLQPAIKVLSAAPGWQETASRWLESAMSPLAFLERLNDPRGVYAYCFCDTR
ncbi:MAG TPA: signal peptide peptidase SppA [Gammaproteobacteria bacterium]|nr:signal peptide peptidase SppA [Gammaproteobacteria bacterium]